MEPYLLVTVFSTQFSTSNHSLDGCLVIFGAAQLTLLHNLDVRTISGLPMGAKLVFSLSQVASPNFGIRRLANSGE
jgi:hypothetical protein